MRKVDRSSVKAPTILTEINGAGQKEYSRAKLNAEKRAAGIDVKSVAFNAYADNSVKLALEKLFHGKCAYCESNYTGVAPVDVEHFRPKSSVAGDDHHSGYWWLAMQWENLLPSCLDCNRRRWHDVPEVADSFQQFISSQEARKKQFKLGKGDFFPIAGTRAVDERASLIDERAELIDPCTDDVDVYITHHVDRSNPISLMLPKEIGGLPSRRGLISISVYGLNRLGLVQQRTKVLRTLEFLQSIVEDLVDLSATLTARAAPGDQKIVKRLDQLADKVVGEIHAMARPEEPYSTLVVAWLRALASER